MAESDELAFLDASFLTTLRDSDLADLATESADAALGDAVGTVTGVPTLPVPLFGTLRKLTRTYQTVRNIFFIRKCLKYFREIRAIPASERRREIDRRLSPEEQARFSEHVVLVLDRLNDVDKASLMGLVTRAFLEGQISFLQLRSLNLLIDAIDPRLIPAIKRVSESYQSTYLDEDERTLLAHGLLTLSLEVKSERVGVADIDGWTHDDGPMVTGVRVAYTATELARLFCKTCLHDAEPTSEPS